MNRQLKRICLFDVDGTLTKPRNVLLIISIENLKFYVRMFIKIEKSYGYRIRWW